MTVTEREERARQALAEITPAGTFGGLLSETAEDDGVYTMLFAATMGGYPGWHWTVSLAEVPGEPPTVLETELMPGDGALLAPDWVPWSERLEEYRAAQAAAGEPDETVLATDDDDDEDDEDDEDDHDLDDDHGDDPDDGIDFESEPVVEPVEAEASDLFAVGEDEEDEAEGESDEDGPEPPVAAAGEQGREEEE